MKKVEIVDLMDFCTEELADQGIDIEIFDPNGRTMGIIINMKGSDSQAYITADRASKNRNLELAKRKRDFTVGMSPEDQEADLIYKMKACFNYWKQVIGEDEDGNRVYKDTIRIGGEELPSKAHEFAKLIERRGFFFIRQQVQEGMDKTSRFLPQQKISSSRQQSSASSMIPPEKME